MNHHPTRADAQAIHFQVETLYRQASRRVLATLIRLLGHFERAEEALQDASSPPSSNDRTPVCHTTPAPGLFRLAVSRRSTACAVARVLMPRWCR